MFTWIRYNIKGDKWIWLIAVILSIISLLSVYSATGSLAYQKMGGKGTNKKISRNGST